MGAVSIQANAVAIGIHVCSKLLCLLWCYHLPCDDGLLFIPSLEIHNILSFHLQHREGATNVQTSFLTDSHFVLQHTTTFIILYTYLICV